MAALPLVLLHAYPLDARMWNAVREPLAAHTRLITPDQRGLGRSPLPAPDADPGAGPSAAPNVDAGPSLDHAARDVVALLDRLELDRVVLGGCSMGGYLTMAVLRAAPERVGGLVLIDTKADADGDDARANRLQAAERAESEGTGWLAEAMLPNLLSEHTHRDQPEVAALVRELVDSQPPAGVAWAQRAMAARPDSFDTLRAASVPALVLVGEQDTLTTPDAARAMAEALPDARLETIPDAGHLTPLEAPDAVVAAITDWYPAA
ncbi:alpha/beta hydrolase [Saccharomonospora sp. CUA-673]|uniref:alpha/beta fold hydrolase n=1 Tax=Saccharomonospora sp. CUA-673 TaxID=1904969 RepID=UPI0009684137|nr:alpha/beta hydrolase [Saccharomonospora sp. CUA-673]OLT43651.1 alpha/beta hydrolase [Saccharomonospora sp. CUA-673]